MNEALLSLLCSQTFLAATLLVTGVSAHQLIRLAEGVIRATRRIDHDLYRAILFPYRQSHEADVTGLSALFFYPRFMKAILSGDFTELNGLRGEHNKIAAYALAFLGSVPCLLFWAVQCKGP